MQQSKRVFRLYIWRNQGSVCIVDAVAIKRVEMGGSLVGIEGMGSRRGSANIWGRLPSLLLIHPPPTVLHFPPSVRCMVYPVYY